MDITVSSTSGKKNTKKIDYLNSRSSDLSLLYLADSKEVEAIFVEDDAPRGS